MDRSSRCCEHAGEIKQKKYREGLLAYADQARQSRELVTIRTDVDVPFETERFRFRGADRERCYALFSKMEFRTLVPEFAPTASSVDKDYALIESTEELAALVAELKAAGRFSLKVITDGTAPVRATLVGIAVSTAASKARYIPLGHEGFGGGFSLAKSEALAMLAPLLTDPSIEKIGHDLKADADRARPPRRRHPEPEWLRHHARAATWWMRTARARRSSRLRSSNSATRRSPKTRSRQGRQGRGLCAGAGGQRARSTPASGATWRCSWPRAWSRRWMKDELESVYRDLEWPLVPILAADRTHRRARGCASRWRRSR